MAIGPPVGEKVRRPRETRPYTSLSLRERAGVRGIGGRGVVFFMGIVY